MIQLNGILWLLSFRHISFLLGFAARSYHAFSRLLLQSALMVKILVNLKVIKDCDRVASWYPIFSLWLCNNTWLIYYMQNTYGKLQLHHINAIIWSYNLLMMQLFFVRQLKNQLLRSSVFLLNLPRIPDWI